MPFLRYKGRQNFITGIGWTNCTATLREPLTVFIKDAKSLAVGGWKDHVHVFFGLPPAISIQILWERQRVIAVGG